MELAHYIRLFRKWFWLLLVCAFVGGGVSFIVSAGKPPVYSASTTISIGRYIDSPNPDNSDIQLGINLAQTYAQIIRTNDVLQGTIDTLNLKLTPSQLDGLFNTNILTGTSLLVVVVQYTNPTLTADIANTLAAQLILRSPTNLTASQQAEVDYANKQIDALDTQLQEQRQSLASINAQLVTLSDPQEISRMTDLQTSLTEQITQGAAAIAQFQSTISAIQQRTNALDIVDRAATPTSALRSNIVELVALGALVGLFIASSLALIIEYFDDRVQTTELAAQLLELPVLGAFPHFGKRRAPYSERLIDRQASMTAMAEAYRRLQTNLIITTGGQKSMLVITSPGAGEGKSVISANLAATMANDGIRVLLIDGDLRGPTQHEIFGLDNQVGLSTLLNPNMIDKVRSESDQEKEIRTHLNQCIQSTMIPNLKVITSGFIPSNPTQMLRSSLLKRWIEVFKSARDIDVIIVDTPPVLLFGDSVILATATEAAVLLVVDSQHTRVREAQATKTQLTHVGIDVRGVILNQINPREEPGRDGYDSYYYAAGQKGGKKGQRRSFLPWQR